MCVAAMTSGLKDCRLWRQKYGIYSLLGLSISPVAILTGMPYDFRFNVQTMCCLQTSMKSLWNWPQPNGPMSMMLNRI